MNKKGIIAIVVVIVVVLAGYMIWGGKSSTSVTTNPSTPNQAVNQPSSNTPDNNAAPTVSLPAGVTKDTTDASLMTRLSSVSVDAAETGSRIALVNGKAQFSTGSVQSSIALGNIATETTFGGASYVFATLGVSTGDSNSQYAVLFSDNNGTLTDQSYDLIGSGVQVTGLRADQISGGLVVTVTFTDASGAAHSKILVVENGAFNPAKDISL